MQASYEAWGGEMQWMKPERGKRRFELRAGEEILATLRWTARSRATAQWAEEIYQFERRGWLRPRTIVERADEPSPDVETDLDQPFARFEHRNGTLVLADGRTFRWTRPSKHGSERAWLDGNATELVRLRPAARNAGTTVSVTAPGGPSSAKLPLLILLGQYLLVLESQDAEAANSAAMVAIIASS